MHHVKPVVNGGSHDLANLVVLCQKHHAEAHPFLRLKLLRYRRRH